MQQVYVSDKGNDKNDGPSLEAPIKLGQLLADDDIQVTGKEAIADYRKTGPGAQFFLGLRLFDFGPIVL